MTQIASHTAGSITDVPDCYSNVTGSLFIKFLTGR
jgi:hypothetical protein